MWMYYADIIVKNFKIWYENGNKKSNHHHRLQSRALSASTRETVDPSNPYYMYASLTL